MQRLPAVGRRAEDREREVPLTPTLWRGRGGGTGSRTRRWEERGGARRVGRCGNRSGESGLPDREVKERLEVRSE